MSRAHVCVKESIRMLPIAKKLSLSTLKPLTSYLVPIFSTHLPYTLSRANLIPAGITQSTFVSLLPVMVSLFHIPLAE